MSPENFELRRVMPEQIGEQWPRIEPMLVETKHLWEELWTLESIEQNLTSGGFQLWIAHIDEHHFLFTMSRVMTYPACRILCFWWAKGAGIDDYMWAIVDEMNKVAHSLGCTRMEMEIGRKGWAPKMEQYGVKLSRQILWREVMETTRQ